jgi:carbon-monoxide dehydrogenase small subunit
MTVSLSLVVNGTLRTVAVEPRTVLVDVLRRHLGLTGTHVGCDTSQCGACVVHLDGRSVKSCSVLALTAEGGTVVTIEGLGGTEGVHPVQVAFRRHHALQCGFCTAGMIMTGAALVERHGTSLDAGTTRQALDGNICRCTGYQSIVDAIVEAAHGDADA